MKAPWRLEAGRAQLLVVDIQERLLPHIHEYTRVVEQTARMCRAAAQLALPVTLTEQYPEGLGATTPAVREVTSDATRLEKLTFSVWQDAALREHLTDLDRPQVLIAGIETHVCVQQTVFDLLDAQMTPFVLADAVGSRRALDWETALRRMERAGATVTTFEAAVFGMLDRCDTELFKRILPIVK